MNKRELRNTISRHQTALQWLVASACLVIAGWLILDQDRDALHAFRIDWWALATTPIVLALYFLLFSERSRFLVHVYGSGRARMLPFLYVLIVSRFLNNLVPQTGNIYRGMRLKRDLGLPWKGYAVTTITTALADISGLVVIGLAALTMDRTSLQGYFPSVPESGPGIILVSIAAALAVFPVLAISNMLSNRHTEKSGEAGRVPTLGQSLSVIIMPGVAVPLFLQTIVLLLTLSTVLWLVFRSLGVDAGFLTAVLFVIVTRLVQYVAITPGNIGPRELIYGFLGSQIVIGSGAAVAASIVLRVLSWAILAILLVIANLVTDRSEPNRMDNRSG